MWDLPIDNGDTHPAGILEVSTLLSRFLVSPLPRPPRRVFRPVQAAEGDKVTLPYGPRSAICDLDSEVESNVGSFVPL
jgi:hypothetical protein